MEQENLFSCYSKIYIVDTHKMESHQLVVFNQMNLLCLAKQIKLKKHQINIEK